jgi:hypothetical protein
LLGGSLGTLSLLFGTSFMPDQEESLLLLEDDEEVLPVHFDRLLQSLIHQPGFEGVLGIVIGRFQRASEMGLDTLKAIIGSKGELARLPVVANASFGHTAPRFTFPIGVAAGCTPTRAPSGCSQTFTERYLRSRPSGGAGASLQLEARLFEVEVALDAVHGLVCDLALVAQPHQGPALRV